MKWKQQIVDFIRIVLILISLSGCVSLNHDVRILKKSFPEHTKFCGPLNAQFIFDEEMVIFSKHRVIDTIRFKDQNIQWRDLFAQMSKVDKIYNYKTNNKEYNIEMGNEGYLLFSEGIIVMKIKTK